MGLMDVMLLLSLFDPSINLRAPVFASPSGVVIGHFPAHRAARMGSVEALARCARR